MIVIDALFALNMAFLAFLAGALLSLIIPSRKNFAFTVIGSLLSFSVSVEGLNGIKGETFPFLPTEVGIDAFSAFFIAVLSILGAALGLYLLSYREHVNVRFLGMGTNMAFLSALLFLATDNLERLTLAYELFIFFTLAIILASETKASRKAAWRYGVLSQVFGIVPLLLLTSLSYAAVGNLHSLTFEGIGENLRNLPVGLGVVYTLLLSSSVVRSGVFPLHTWVRRVYRAVPSPFVVVFIMGETLGFYLLARLTYFTFGPSPILGYVVASLGAVSAFATLYSFSEVHLKRKFAFHSVMDTGIAFFALGSSMVLPEKLGAIVLAGALLHTLYQSLYKSAIYLGLGTIEHFGEDPNICSLRKLLRGHVMSLLISLSAFSMAGFPPLASFISRWLIYGGIASSTNVLLWLMLIGVGFLGLFPLASILQIRRINMNLCKREVEREEIPSLMRFSTGFLALLGFAVAVFPLLFFPFLKNALGEVASFPETLSGLFFSGPGSAVGGTILITAIYTGWKIGKMPTDRVSELFLIFYNAGDILKTAGNFFLDAGRRGYINYILPVIKVVPKHELPLVRDYDDALDYPVRHLDEAMFMPLVGAIERLAKWNGSKRRDMNVLIGGFAIAMAVLIVLLGVFA